MWQPSLEVPLNADEAYRLVVNNGKVTVEAVTEAVCIGLCKLWLPVDLLRKKRQHSTFNCSFNTLLYAGYAPDVGAYMSIEELKREIAVLSRLGKLMFFIGTDD